MGVLRWVAAKIGAVILVAWVVATFVFFALRASGNPLEAILGGPGSQASAEAVEQATRDYGLDQPLFMQYFAQLWRVATFQLGDSYGRKQPVAELIGAQLPSTVVLAVLALTLAWVLALGAIALSIRTRGPIAKVINAFFRGGEILASVLPSFWLGAVLIVVFASWWQLFPATSAGFAPSSLVLPVFTLAIPIAGFLGQIMRGGLDEATSAPFATTARARGASETRVFWMHTLRHAALPAISLSGWAFGSLLSGAVVVEALFARPGLGRLLQDAANTRDVPLVIGAVLVVAVLYVVIITIADLIERAVDPRTRQSAWRVHRKAVEEAVAA
ncbi:ABC transporter permease [Humidisolicoccus flavus]|uniref:ABC transporter permease n=1 Tax=Humidisolicoccus flavus TaxID=3111414 RepID=UPI00324DFEC3